MTLFNLGNQQQARWAFRAAAEAAEEAEDDLLGAWVLASECIIPTYSGDPWGVLKLTCRGQRLAADRQRVAVAKLAALEAKAYASLGNHNAAYDALAQARRVMKTATEEEIRPGPFGYTPAKHAFYEGTCYVRLARPDAALAASRRALDLYRSTRAFMEPTIARIDMATAYAQKGDLDGACHLGDQIAAIPAELRTGPISARASEFLRSLRPHERALPAVQALRGRLALDPPPNRPGKH
jgi:tetratricopeptide (TPR) repeat protein